MKIMKQFFASFSPQLLWCKEGLFTGHNMAPFQGLLYNSSSVINVHFKGLCQMSSIFVSFKNFIFRCILFLMLYNYNNLKFRKKFLTSDLLATISWNLYGQYLSYLALLKSKVSIQKIPKGRIVSVRYLPR